MLESVIGKICSTHSLGKFVYKAGKPDKMDLHPFDRFEVSPVSVVRNDKTGALG